MVRNKSVLRQGQQRPGGRTERTRLNVAQAVLDLLEAGVIDFTAEDVAKRADTHRTTVNRRWPYRKDLIREALTLHSSELKARPAGNWPEDVKRLVSDLANFFSNPVEMHINAASIAHAGDEVVHEILEYWEPVMEKLTGVIESAQAQGSIPAEISARRLLDMLLAPMLMYTLFERKPVPRKHVSEIVAILLSLGAARTN